MRISIITPTLQRESLVRCCESINNQTLKSWTHIVQMDCADEDLNSDLMFRLAHPQRLFFCCGQKHGNYGNRCRHLAWEHAAGEYLIYLDDDNFLADDKILEDISIALADDPKWAIFPIHRHGWYFFHDPPGMCMIDTLNVVVQREIGRWPDIEPREADGYWVEALKDKYPYAAFPQFRPIGIMETSSNGI